MAHADDRERGLGERNPYRVTATVQGIQHVAITNRGDGSVRREPTVVTSAGKLTEIM